MIAIALAAAVAQAPLMAKPACQIGQPVATRSDQSLKPRKLGEMPPGLLMRAVLLTVGGCPAVEEREPTGASSPSWRWTLRITGQADATPALGDH